MTMPKGTYWVGDLCYVLHDDQWDEVCNWMFSEDIDGHGGEFTLSCGTKIAMYGTRWGDGTYSDTSGREYPVDSGSLGCVLAECVDPSTSGNVISFRDDFTTEITGSDGEIVRFGHVRINTGDFEDEYPNDY